MQRQALRRQRPLQRHRPLHWQRQLQQRQALGMRQPLRLRCRLWRRCAGAPGRGGACRARGGCSRAAWSIPATSALSTPPSRWAALARCQRASLLAVHAAHWGSCLRYSALQLHVRLRVFVLCIACRLLFVAGNKGQPPHTHPCTCPPHHRHPHSALLAARPRPAGPDGRGAVLRRAGRAARGRPHA